MNLLPAALLPCLSQGEWYEYLAFLDIVHSISMWSLGTAKPAGHLRIAGCIQRPKVSGHPSQDFKWPTSDFFSLFLLTQLKGLLQIATTRGAD